MTMFLKVFQRATWWAKQSDGPEGFRKGEDKNGGMVVVGEVRMHRPGKRKQRVSLDQSMLLYHRKRPDRSTKTVEYFLVDSRYQRDRVVGEVPESEWVSGWVSRSRLF